MFEFAKGKLGFGLFPARREAQNAEPVVPEGVHAALGLGHQGEQVSGRLEKERIAKPAVEAHGDCALPSIESTVWPRLRHLSVLRPHLLRRSKNGGNLRIVASDGQEIGFAAQHWLRRTALQRPKARIRWTWRTRSGDADRVSPTERIFSALVSGETDVVTLLGLDRASIAALVEKALFDAEHGQVARGCRLMAALADAMPKNAPLALMAGHLEAEREAFDAALERYGQARTRNEAADRDPELGAEICLSWAKLLMRLGRVDGCDELLAEASTQGGSTVRVQAKAMQVNLRNRGN